MEVYGTTLELPTDEDETGALVIENSAKQDGLAVIFSLTGELRSGQLSGGALSKADMSFSGNGQLSMTIGTFNVYTDLTSPTPKMEFKNNKTLSFTATACGNYSTGEGLPQLTVIGRKQSVTGSTSY